MPYQPPRDDVPKMGPTPSFDAPSCGIVPYVAADVALTSAHTKPSPRMTGATNLLIKSNPHCQAPASLVTQADVRQHVVFRFCVSSRASRRLSFRCAHAKADSTFEDLGACSALVNRKLNMSAPGKASSPNFPARVVGRPQGVTLELLRMHSRHISYHDRFCAPGCRLGRAPGVDLVTPGASGALVFVTQATRNRAYRGYKRLCRDRLLKMHMPAVPTGLILIVRPIARYKNDSRAPRRNQFRQGRAADAGEVSVKYGYIENGQFRQVDAFLKRPGFPDDERTGVAENVEQVQADKSLVFNHEHPDTLK